MESHGSGTSDARRTQQLPLVDNLGLLKTTDEDAAVVPSMGQINRPSKRSFSSVQGHTDASHEELARWAPSPTSGGMTIEEASVLPDRELRDELVLLYFCHIHPLCPFIDEYRFCEVYYMAETDEDLLAHINIGLFQSMMFAAFTHINDEFLQKSPYESIHTGHRVLVDKARTLYRSQISGHPLVLTQIALLLSFWSPCDSDDAEVNRFWVDKAIEHARAARLWDLESQSSTVACRSKLLWWCCLARDRVTSCGLRIPHRLEITESKLPMIVPLDFGLESAFPRFVDVQLKQRMISAFIYLCKLSDIMMAITVFTGDKSGNMKGSFRAVSAPVMEIHRLRALDTQLMQWQSEFQRDLKQTNMNSLPSYCKMQLYSLDILSHALLAALYRPYVNKPPTGDQLIDRVKQIALRKMAEGSIGVATAVQGIISDTNIEDIPVILIAWLVLPICFYEVKRNMKLNHPDSFNSNHLFDMLNVISSISGRFGGALYVSGLMSHVGDLVASKVGELSISPLKRRMSIQSRNSAQSTNSSETDVEDFEAEILDIAARVVDLKLAVNVSANKL